MRVLIDSLQMLLGHGLLAIALSHSNTCWGKVAPYSHYTLQIQLALNLVVSQ